MSGFAAELSAALVVVLVTLFDFIFSIGLNAIADLRLEKVGFRINRSRLLLYCHGEKEQSANIIGQLKENPNPRGRFRVAEIHSGMGDKEQAFAWLEKCYEARCPSLGETRSYPQFDRLAL